MLPVKICMQINLLHFNIIFIVLYVIFPFSLNKETGLDPTKMKLICKGHVIEDGMCHKKACYLVPNLQFLASHVLGSKSSLVFSAMIHF